MIVKARNVLAAAVESGTGGTFSATLLDDIRNYGTLAERTLRKIVDASRDADLLRGLLAELKSEMGEDYLNELRNDLPKGEVVIAIEHRDDYPR